MSKPKSADRYPALRYQRSYKFVAGVSECIWLGLIFLRLCLLRGMVPVINKGLQPFRQNGAMDISKILAVGADEASMSSAVNYLQRHAPVGSALYLYVPRQFRQKARTHAGSATFVLVNLRQAILYRWTLAVFTAHRHAPFVDPTAKKLWIGTGTNLNQPQFGGERGILSWQALSGFQRTPYNVFAGTSRRDRALAVREPYMYMLADRIWVGDLRRISECLCANTTFMPALEKELARPWHIDVCIATYKRPHMLDHLFAEGLCRQTTDGTFTFTVHVCDNDASASARAVVDSYRGLVDLTYRVEPRQNISLARNSSMEDAKGDFIAIIDDDAIPVPDWLLQLVGTARRTGADVIRGPNSTAIAPGASHQACDHFKVKPRGEGPSEKMALDTCNSMIRRELMTKLALSFDRCLGQTGGEDLDFFLRLKLAGALFCWSPLAKATTTLHSGRETRRYLLARRFHRGQLNGYMAQRHRLSWTGKTATIGKCLLVVPVAMAASLAWPFRQEFAMKYLTKAAFHLGYVDFFLRRRLFKEYAAGSEQRTIRVAAAARGNN